MKKLAMLRFFDVVTVPGGRILGGDVFGDACESSFLAADGWDITEVAQGVITLKAPHMPRAWTQVTCDYGYFEAPILVEPVDTEEVLSGEWKRQHAKKVKR